jgi:hypothetical protein
MKRIDLFFGLVALLTAAGISPALRAADEAAPSGRAPIPPELREQLRNLPPEEREAKMKEWRQKQRAQMEKRREELKNLSPEEREAKLKEWRQQRAEGLPGREELQKRREELKNLSPEERRKKIQDWQEQQRADRPEFKSIAPEEREARRKEMRERLEQQLTDLRKKKAGRTLTDAEQRRLERMEELSKRFGQGDAQPGLRPGPPVARPDKPQKSNDKFL